MQQYEIIRGPLFFLPGMVVYLTQEQAKPRQASIKQKPDGSYKVLHTIQFKTGEIIGLNEKPTKNMLGSFKPIKVKDEKENDFQNKPENRAEKRSKTPISANKEEPDS